MVGSIGLIWRALAYGALLYAHRVVSPHLSTLTIAYMRIVHDHSLFYKRALISYVSSVERFRGVGCALCALQLPIAMAIAICSSITAWLDYL